MDTKKSKNLKNDFYNWCERNNKQPKSQEEVQDLLVTFITENKEKYPEEYAKIQTAQKKTTRALHGAKLNYFKSLKHQCAEDEEVVYYKKGGSVTCGCKKKEQGGEVPSAKDGAVAKFKNRKNISAPQQQINPNDTIHVNGQIKSLTNEPIKDKNNTYKPLTPEEYKKLKDKDKNRVDEKDAARGRQVHKCGGKVKKGEDGLLPIKNPKGKPSKNINRGGTKSKLPVQSKGSKINKDCGGSVAKFKALRKGGSLNRIHFMQTGTPEGGINIIKRGINGEYYYNPIPYGASNRTGTNPFMDILTTNISNNPYLITGAPDFLPGMAGGNIGKVVGQIRKLPIGKRGAVRTINGKKVNILDKKVGWAKEADIRKSIDPEFNSKLAGRIDYSK